MRPASKTKIRAFGMAALPVLLAGCALPKGSQQGVKWLIIDGCMIEITGVASENWEESLKTMEIGDDCTVTTKTETEAR